MGNNQSISPNSTGIVFHNSNNTNLNFISGNGPYHSLFDDDFLVDDLSEDQFIGVIQAITNKEEILRIIRGIALPVQKKARKTRHS